MNNKLYDTLEICLQALENGDSLDSILTRYPDLESELRPILEAAQQARAMPAPMPSTEAMRRGKARLLQQAAEMREAKRPTRGRQRVIPLFQRLAISLSLTVAALMGGTGLVQASSTALPGENLYPVKRTWEDMRLLFVFSPTAREALTGEYEQERLDEVSELLREGRVVSITFSGVVTESSTSRIVVSTVPVAITNSTTFSGDPLTVGSAVIVTGQTDSAGHVSAMAVQVLPPGSVVPTGENDESEKPSNVNGNDGGSAPSNNGSDSQEENGSDAPKNTFHIEGTVQSIDGNVWVIDGQTVYVNDPALLMLVKTGMQVEVRGYFTADGRFIVTQVEIKNSGRDRTGTNPTSNSGSSDDGANVNGNENSNDDNGGNNNSSDDSGSKNENKNDNSNSNSNDNHSGGGENGNENNNNNSNNDD